MGDQDGRDEMLERPPELGAVFDLVATDYEARPAYPERVFQILAERCGLGPGARVLEIGAGTGQATLPILERGGSVTAVEPGAALARRLVERTGAHTPEVVVAPFEALELPEASFDLVVSATAFHWVDTSVGLRKCAQALRGGGWLALWWTIWGDPDRPDPFHEALRPVLRAKAPHLLKEETGVRAYISDLEARMAQIDSLGSFGPVSHEVMSWEGRHGPAELRRIFATFAQWIALAEPLRTELLDDVERIVSDGFGGTIHRPYQTRLYLAQRLTS